MPVQVHRGEIEKQPGSVVALGMFDGMHIGHRCVIARAVEIAHEMNLKSVVYTFSNHPRAIYDTAPREIMSVEQRRHVMLEMGVDTVDMVLFDRVFSELSPEAFLKQIIERHDVRVIVAGSDFTFGYKGQGTVDTLRAFSKTLGFCVCVVPFVMLDGEKVSSTRIRKAMEAGDAELAKKLMEG